MQNLTPGSSFDRRLYSTWRNILTLIQPVKELKNGFRQKAIPLNVYRATGIIALLLTMHVDLIPLRKIRLAHFLVSHDLLYWAYFAAILTTPFWGWAWYQVWLRSRLSKKLTEVFTNAGLKNRVGKFPSFISNDPIDYQTWKLKVTAAQMPKSEFEKAKPALESGLQVYIDEIKETREHGVVELLYSHAPMPKLVVHENIKAFKDFHFLVGKTRLHEVRSNLSDTPHLLVAGPTNKGKSTFLRQFITTILLNNPCQFLLIDLKGGLEFSLFKNISKALVAATLKDAIRELLKLERILKERMAILEGNNCKDIEAYFALMKSKEKPEKTVRPYVELTRHIVVVDEAAEMFLAGSHAEGSEIQKARRVLSQIARQGRAVGIHLVIATQRPDVKSLDPQVKANLSGVLCLPMLNDASSISVLGNGRATDLPPVAGRAIWKDTSYMVEVQTPLLTEAEASALLEPLRTPPTPTPPATAAPVISMKGLREESKDNNQEVELENVA